MTRYLFPILSLLMTLCGLGEAVAQVENYALKLSADHSAQSAHEVSLERGAAYTIQLSTKCEQWSEGSVVISLGKVSLAQSGVEGIYTLSLSEDVSHQLSLGVACYNWTQLSFVASSKGLDVWVGGQLHDSYVGDYSWQGEASRVKLGGGFCGAIDELRIFASEVDDADLSHFNTLNKFHPNWESLALYYKFDQLGCVDRIIDYRGENVAYVAGGGAIERVKNEDQRSRYMVVSGYSSFIRHNDREFIDRDMHLMTNDLIMLDALVDGHTGRVYMQSAENAQIEGKALYRSELDGRKGLLSLNGNARMSYIDNNFVDSKYLSNALNVSMWLRLEKWSEGATLYRKSVNAQDEVVVSLTAQSERGVLVKVDGAEFIFGGALFGEKQWQHVAVNISPRGGSTEVSLYVNNSLKGSQSIGKELVINDMEAVAYIGDGLVGALDNVIIGSASRSDFADYMAGESRDLKFPGGGPAASQVLGAWLFECELRPERNVASWQSKIEAIRAIYGDCAGYKIRVGIITHTVGENGQKVWMENIKLSEWRATLTADVARLMTHFDGVDIDFEWLDNNPQNPAWAAYGSLIKSLDKVIDQDDVLSASLHPVSYTLPLEAEVMDCVDYITVQNYGPRHTYLKMDQYVKFLHDAVNYGIPPHKIFLSMATLIVRSDNSGVEVSGYKNLDFEGFTTSTNQAIYRDVPYTFNSVDEVKRKMELLREEGSGGCMYFDMGNDLRVSHPLSLIGALNSVISSNVDKKID